MQISWVLKSYFLITGGLVLSSIFSALLGNAGVAVLLVMVLGAMRASRLIQKRSQNE
jgi:hypothetical protein